ncbi:FGGY-family carbohydrate kinase [Kribbella solani]|uniref:FGGY-family carbohydrate kinase n=1 Tax=Kribbella solani TaxID=236067 RepID=UPI0029AAE0E8|nr:FGGY-family carbohydrate kinase [Kribbella solani]MDX2972969.1 FGGY-family carbohydrate kinase [Kribbella solani]MDX3006696.1 FGGY-family carbohydrate kinase [Kribbella solani]
MAWIGLDLGTQSVRAVLADAKGAVLARATRPLTGRRDGVRHEQNPQDWLDAVDAVLAEVTLARPEGIAICSTSGTFLLTDRAGRPVTPALMYDDARAAARRDQIVDADPDRWSTSMQPTWALPKILELVADGYDLADHRVVHSADFVAAHLVGHPVATDTSHALKTGYDLNAEAWPAAFDKLGLPLTAFPEVVRPGAELGRTPDGVPVRAGMTDGCAAQIAAGALAPGAWNSVLGTTLVLKGVSNELLTDPTGAVYSHRHPDGGWLPGGASSTGAGVLTELLPGADLAALDRAARANGPVDAVSYPLTKTGERFPFVAPQAERFTLGSTPDDLHVYTAVLQGVAFIERLAFEHLETLGADPVRSVSLTGGATRGGYWNQLRADVLGVPVELPAVPDPAYGMAVLAASGGTDLTGTARRMVRVDHVLEPRGNRLDDLYGDFVAELDHRGYRA